MKKEGLIYSIIIIALVFTTLLLFYTGYVKPEREYIKLKAEYCTEEAFEPINKEINKIAKSFGLYEYKSKREIEKMVEERNEKLEECYKYYDSIFFSSSESNVYILKLNKLFDEQQKKIEKYNNRDFSILDIDESMLWR